MDEFNGLEEKKSPEATKQENNQPEASSLVKPGISYAESNGNSKSSSTKAGGFADFVIARLGDRLIAISLDSALLLGFLAVVGMYSASKFGGITEKGFSLEGKPALISLGLLLVVGLAYHWLLEGLAGATLGKVAMGLRVVGPSGRHCGLKPSLVRNLLRLVDGLGFYLVGLLVAIFSRKRQRTGRSPGKTVVVEYPTSNVFKAGAVFLWILGVGSGIWFAYGVSPTGRFVGSSCIRKKGSFCQG